MSTNLDDLIKSALEPSPVDPLRLATELMDSMPDDPPGFACDDPALLVEIEARVNDGSAGIPWEQVQSILRADLDRD